ncbi:Outer-membrane lipoprotein carrier protein [Andreprevotia sp. IGB-42]|uniref:LolA family protein n=1 Tax=Andreprevotia sp. IGB-42 TaxID=2497473 RepID=UPI001359085E|nr:outer membrane lipoprotein carrier protein LolA [Andreprevotia sp. IGB-42]KAF0813787.1 Outer-membrane lipoprotein carrier protein [Andreprevotia sp. IGB-42]
MKCLLPAALLAAMLMMTGHVASASELLDKVAKQVTDSAVVRGNFVQTRELVGVKKPLKSEGRFVVDKQRGVVWQTARPFNNKLRISRQEIVQKDGDQVLMRMSADKEPAVKTVGSVLFALFAGDFATLERYFNVSGEAGNNGWQLQLTPRDAALGKLIGKLALDGGKTIAHVRLEGGSGDITRIDLKEVVNSDRLSASEAADFD